jgi:hypothetical protein
MHQPKMCEGTATVKRLVFRDLGTILDRLPSILGTMGFFQKKVSPTVANLDWVDNSREQQAPNAADILSDRLLAAKHHRWVRACRSAGWEKRRA